MRSVIAGALLLALAVPAAAKELPEVEAYWRAGNIAYEARDWDRAYERFWYASSIGEWLHPNPVLLYNMAQAARMAWEDRAPETRTAYSAHAVSWSYANFLQEVYYRYTRGEGVTDAMRERLIWARKCRDRFAAIARKEGPR